jgi:hypothetical protein
MADTDTTAETLPPLAYTFVRDADGDTVDCSCGDNYAVLEFRGFCERCWVRLTPAQRAILLGEEPPVVQIIERTVHPPKSGLGMRLLEYCWRIAMTAAVIQMVLHRR